MYKGSDLIIEFLSARKSATVEEIVKATKLNVDSVRRALEWLRDNGHVTTKTSSEEKLIVKDEFHRYYESGSMPEYDVFKKAIAGAAISELLPQEKQFGLSWAKVKGYVTIESGKLVPQKNQADIDGDRKKLWEIFNIIKEKGTYDDPATLEELFRRKLIERRTEKTIIVDYTGKKLEQTSFDISVKSENAAVGKQHPISFLTKKIKRIFAELGFSEMTGSIVESAFWNFDALFQPQDHPARELADTFYLNGEAELPDKKLIERVKKSHEAGWKYKWTEQEAKRLVLRTHTTALSARYLAANYEKKDPKKYFAIGSVFRNEATDYKHLAEFHQVEGIIAWEHATFRDLLGILKEFYMKLGFDKIRFRPSFFPYTEPSLEVEVFFEPRKQWLELGGAGIFRPEVSVPLANVYPVLAWGLSLERPLMLMLGLEDIRTFYRNDLDFLKSVRL